MTGDDLQRLRHRFTLGIAAGFALTPFVGLGGAWLFGLIDADGLRRSMQTGILPGALIFLLGWNWLSFRAYLQPFLHWLAQHPQGGSAPGHLHRRLGRFSREYWGMFLLYALLTPTLLFAGGPGGFNTIPTMPFVNVLLVQIAVAVLVGLPTYLIALDRLGKLVAHLGLQQVQVSIKSKIMLLGGFLPLLSYSILMHYQWVSTGRLAPELAVIWGALALVTSTVTWLAIKSMAQSLRPVQEVLSRSGASTHADLARLRPQSTDEIGYLTQTLGKLFRRLGDQESTMRAVVDNAAEGIIVVDEHGRIDTFNAAAEKIFGFLAAEIRGKPLSWLLPHLAGAQAVPPIASGEQETAALHRNGQPLQVSVRASEMHISGEPMYICLVADITEQKAFQKQLSYQAEHDALTGLFNRHYFQQELERTVARVARSGADCAVFYIDLDQFKYINDTLGHAAGDRLLVEITHRVSAHVREGDLLARFGGDEFTLLVYNIKAQDVPRVAENFRALFENYKFHYEGKNFNVTSSIGASLIDANAVSADEAMAHADLACNMAKAQGRNRVHLYNPDDRDKAGMAEDMGWAARVREMLEHDRFQLVYQPIMSLSTGDVHDYEVLVRMVCVDGEIILPGGFMPAAERFGLIHNVDRWVVARAIHQLANLREHGSDVRFSINLSGKAFEDSILLPTIQRLLKETGLDPALLTFEITETAAIANLNAATQFIGALKDIGCQFALDDFGSGFSSFTYLKHLPVDKLKIDGSFVQSMAQTPVDQAMVQSMNQVAHALGKQTIAEYVESAETLQLLKDYGVDFAQGNFIGKPREALMNLSPNMATLTRNPTDNLVTLKVEPPKTEPRLRGES